VGLLTALPRSWWFTDLPGYREHPEAFATYSRFSYLELPPIRRTLDDELNWLRAQPMVSHSLGDVDPGDPKPTRPATASELNIITRGSAIELPSSFRTFIADGEPRKHVRSVTACYLDLAQFPVEDADGGTLIHFLSDQQWVLHWLLYVSPAGAEAVVATDVPFGFDVDGRRFAEFDPTAETSYLCAGSFSEFLYRFWIENEIWSRTRRNASSEPALTDEQRGYAEHYR
jgi:hypothetical protein